MEYLDYGFNQILTELSKHVPAITDDKRVNIQLYAVSNNGPIIKYINNPSLEVQLAAVRADGYAIKYIKNPSFEVQLAAVKKNGYSINYIDEPRLEIQLAAVREDPNSLQYIKNPFRETKVMVSLSKRYKYNNGYQRTKLDEIDASDIYKILYLIECRRNREISLLLWACGGLPRDIIKHIISFL